MDLARNVFSAVHVDDLIMVGSSSQLSEVVGEMKQYFTMKVTHPLSASFTQTYVGARYLRDGDATWELPTARYVTGMLNEHGMQNAKPVVTLVVIATMMTMSLRKQVPKSIAVFDALWAKVSSWHRDDQTLLLLRTVLRGLWHVLQNRTSLRRSVSCDICEVCRDLGLKLQVQNRACSTLTVFTDGDWAGDRPTRKSVYSWVIMLDGFLISAGAPNTVSDCSIVM